VPIREINSIQDVVDWGLCIGCGACAYFCEKEKVSLANVETVGIRPRFEDAPCAACELRCDCLDICPGYTVRNDRPLEIDENHSSLIGPSLEIWEGAAADGEIRFNASSGGGLSALALYCLEKEKMRFVLHVGSDPKKPWINATVRSRTRDDLISRTGSRYAPASPCDSLDLIEKADGPCVFIGKPCDAEAVSLLRKKRPALDRNLGLVLAFFCAGTPSSFGTLDLLRSLDISKDRINTLRYRGRGWPGRFDVAFNGSKDKKTLTYKDSWHHLQKFRPFRCHLCPDGLGETSDITCGDAWHNYGGEDKDPGRSLILARSERGREILHRAIAAGYLDVNKSSSGEVVAAQGLVQKRREVFGRTLAMKMLMIPTPRYAGYPLFHIWSKNSVYLKFKTVAGTLKRLATRGLWHRRRPVGPS